MEEKILFKEKTRKLITAIQIVIVLLGIFMMAVAVAEVLADVQNEWFEETLLWYCQISTIIIAVMIAVSLLLKLAKQKYFVTEQRIYGKKGYKKFDVSFDDILSIKKESKEITIKTEDKILNLFAYKNSAAIYDHIKPYAREEETSQQIVVDDIKLF